MPLSGPWPDTPFLQRQVELLQPKLIVALGRIAAQYLLKTGSSLSSLRGRALHFGKQQTPLLVTYHPAYLLRSPLEKRKAYADLLRVKEIFSASENRRES